MASRNENKILSALRVSSGLTSLGLGLLSVSPFPVKIINKMSFLS